VGGTLVTASFQLERKMGAQPLSREFVMSMAKETGAGAVMVTRMQDYAIEAGKGKAKAYVDVGRQVKVIETENTTQVWVGNYSIHQTPAESIIKNNVFLESSVYDVADNGRLVYTISTESRFDIDSDTYMENVTRDVANAITKNVRKAKLVH
jgi:hypothetical protein